MNSSLTMKEQFIRQFQSNETLLTGEDVSPLHKIRKDAINNFSALNFPSVKDEEWKYTNINPLLNKTFKPANEIPEVDPAIISKYLFNKNEFITLVFINGYFSKEYSEIETLPAGLILETISEAIKKHPQLVLDYFSKSTSGGKNIFTELNTAFADHGTFVFVEENAVIEKPIQILYLTHADEIFVSPRNLFVISKNAQVKIIETFAGFGASSYFTNQVTEFLVNENAVVEHVRIQDEHLQSFHISHLAVELERSSNFSTYNINFGGSFVRNNVNTKFLGEFAECRLNGLYVAEGSQFIDNHTSIDHAKPNCLSNELYKGILNDTAHAVFNGKVFVRRDAQKTNAYQQNKNILLSNEALVNTKPQLEIFADDVKCSHGATVGQLDKEQLFYLKARGIQEKEAKALLLYAFASDVVHSISMLQVRDHLEALLAEKIL